MTKNTRLICQLFTILAAVLLTVEAAAPQLTRLDYTYKRLDLIDLQADLTVLVATFDQEMFVNVSCSGSTPAQFTPCCPVPDVSATGCLSWSASRRCIDGSGVIESNLPTEDSEYFRLNVSNPDTCHSVNILLRTLRGESWLHVSTHSNGGGYLNGKLGSEGLSLCCEQLRRDNPAWDGVLYIEHEPRTPAYAQISIDSALTETKILLPSKYSPQPHYLGGHLLPLVDWHFLSKSLHPGSQLTCFCSEC